MAAAHLAGAAGIVPSALVATRGREPADGEIRVDRFDARASSHTHRTLRTRPPRVGETMPPALSSLGT